jgi:predicted nucleotidyltransferase
MQVTREQIELLARRIAEEFHPQRVVLFGSRANERAREDSDVDLLVIMPYQGSPYQRAAEIRTRCPTLFPLDLIVQSPEDVERRYGLGDPIIREAIDRGVVLYLAAA